ncbi:MAG: recombinase family protein [Magnetococcales bacterium]|nr:recombinase family protein [Magnetococcales bacterium]
MTKPPVKSKTLCAIYTRKSTDEGLEQDFNSLDAQREACESYIASQKAEGWLPVPDRYDDGGFSGGNLERPALKRLLADIEANRVNVVVVYKIDRLSRSLMDFSRLVEIFDRHQVTFVSVTQSFNTTTSMGRLTLNVLLSFAQFERELSAERVRDKIAASKRKGMWMGGHPPLGYDIHERKLRINAAEAETVRFIFRRFLEIGSATRLVKELAAKGYHSKKWISTTGKHYDGHLFNKGSLYKLLNNRVYVGEVFFQGNSYPGEHEAIIDVFTWEKAQAIFARNGQERSAITRRQTPAALKGLVHCHHCQRAMTPSHTRKEGRLYRYYLCTGAAKNGHDYCPMPSVPAGDVEGMVLDHLRAMIHAPEMMVRTWRAANESTTFSEREVLETLRSLDGVWEQLFPAEQMRLSQLLVAKVEVDVDGITLHLRTEGFSSLLLELRQAATDAQPTRKSA